MAENSENRIIHLPPDSLLRDDDCLVADSLTAGTRRFTPEDFSAEVLRRSGDSVYLRAEVVTAIIAAQNARLSTAEARALAAETNAGLAETRSEAAEDAAEAAVAAAQGAVAAANGFPVADYLGEIGALDANPGLAATLVGKWWTVTIEGTLTHASVAGLVVKPGDRLLSNGTAWLRWVLAPAYLTQNSVTRWHLEKWLRDLLTPLNDPNFAFAIVDAVGRRAFAIGHDGTVHARVSLPDGSVGTAAIAERGVTRGKLEAALEEMVGQPLMNADWLFAIVDAEGRIGFGIRANGTCEGKFTLGASSVTTAALAAASVTRLKLETALQQAVPVLVSSAMEFVFSIVDEDDRVAFGIRRDGTLFGRFGLDVGAIVGTAITPNTLPGNSFDPALKRAALSGPGDMLEVDGDGLRRGVAVTVTAGTDPISGELSTRFPYARTRILYGVNTSGTALEFSRAPGFVLRGTRSQGSWAAGAVAPATTAAEGDWWTATGSGTFESVAYLAGDRIVCIGNTRQSATITPRFVKAKAGEFYHQGEFTPASFTPSSPVDGDHWVADASGTFSGMTFAAGDSLLRVGTAWLHFPREDVKTVANGAAWSYRVQNAEEIQVRRADKSATPVNVPATAYTHQAQRQTSDSIIFRGDSMAHGGGLHTELASLISPRVLQSFSWASANSEQVLTSVLRDIAAGDPYRGWLHLWFMGTNDSYDLPKISRGALRAARLTGAADGRCLFLTPIGQWNMSYSGGRIVHFTQEEITAGTHDGAAVNRWFAAMFPGRQINSLAALIAGASDATPSLHHPGMTEKVAAQTYGAAPTSAFYNFAALPFTPAQLTYTGTHSAAGVPTGGTDGDYKIRTANGSVGLLNVRWAGTWQEYPVDITHLSPAGARILAAAVASFLTSNML